ncbi:recombinase family protein [Streptomyces sp. NPDC005708]|uniref:recombinase family protein n=1 Tax=Streptomyces sp. NPDC005708 TaxID=3154564 RepID=UPI0033DE552D
MGDTPPLAYVYDRCVTDSLVNLELRLSALGEYATERRWGWGGWFVDYGDAALTANDRPEFEAMLRAIESAGPGVERLCLVHNWGRLSHDTGHRQTFTRRILTAGAWLETIDGESARIGAAPDGRLTSGPVIA